MSYNRYLFDNLVLGALAIIGASLFTIGHTQYMDDRGYDFPIMAVGGLTYLSSVVETLRNSYRSLEEKVE